MARSKQELVQTAKRRLRRNYDLLDKKAKLNMGDKVKTKITDDAEIRSERAAVEAEVGIRRKK